MVCSACAGPSIEYLTARTQRAISQPDETSDMPCANNVHKPPGHTFTDGAMEQTLRAGGVVVTTAALIIGTVFTVLDRGVQGDPDPLSVEVFFVLAVGVFTVMGVALTRARFTALGTLFSVGALLGALLVATEYASYALLNPEAKFRLGGVSIAWMGDLVWRTGIAFFAPVFLLFFPDGKRPRGPVRAIGSIALWLAVLAGFLEFVGTLFEATLMNYHKAAPLGGSLPAGMAQGLRIAGWVVMFVDFLLAGVCLRDLTRTSAVERHQLRLFLISFGFSAAFLGLSLAFGTSEAVKAAAAAFGLTAGLAYGLAVLNKGRRLEFLVGSTILAGLITAVHETVIVLASELVAHGSSTLLSTLVTSIIVGFLLQPAMDYVIKPLSKRLLNGPERRWNSELA
jgi:hypothetical protein